MRPPRVPCSNPDGFAPVVQLKDSNCHICQEALLNNINISRFGLISWSCGCAVPQKAHSACIFTQISRGQPDCAICRSPMSFAKNPFPEGSSDADEEAKKEASANNRGRGLTMKIRYHSADA